MARQLPAHEGAGLSREIRDKPSDKIFDKRQYALFYEKGLSQKKRFKIHHKTQINRPSLYLSLVESFLRENHIGGIPPPIPGGICPFIERIILRIPPLENFFIIFFICLCCLSKRLTS